MSISLLPWQNRCWKRLQTSTRRLFLRPLTTKRLDTDNRGMQLLVKSQMQQKTENCYCTHSCQCHLLKTEKSKAFHYPIKDTEDGFVPPGQNTMNIKGGNACFHSLKEMSRTFKQIIQNISSVTTTGKSNMKFSTDSFMQESIKSMEFSPRLWGETVNSERVYQTTRKFRRIFKQKWIYGTAYRVTPYCDDEKSQRYRTKKSLQFVKGKTENKWRKSDCIGISFQFQEDDLFWPLKRVNLHIMAVLRLFTWLIFKTNKK